jgi:superfamily I DNA and RNA helicase
MFRTDLMDQSPNRRKATVLLAGFNNVKQEVVFIIEYIKYFKNNELK